MPDWRAEAVAHIRGGQWELAIQSLQSALAETPEDAEVLHNLGQCFLLCGRAGQAIEVLSRAVQLAPGWGGVHKILGNAFMQDGNAGPAVQAYGAALALDPDDTDGWIKLGVALVAQGQPEQALSAFDAALNLDPGSVAAYYNRRDLKTYAADDPEIGVLEALLPKLSAHDRVMVCFTLGKAWLDAGDAHKAFAYYHSGNSLHRGTYAYDVGASLAKMQDIARLADAETLARLSGAGNPSALPIFVVGMPRSGSTLIEQILASHPMVGGAGEIAAFRTLLQRMRGENGQVLAYPDVLRFMTPDTATAMGELYLKLVAPFIHGKPRLVDKFLDNFLYAGLLLSAFPNARLIHCRRDPVDTCLSCYTLLFGAEQAFAYDLAELGQYWRGYDALMAHWRTVLPADRFIDVDYENVVADFDGQMKRLLDFLGLPWDEACRSFHKTERTVLTASNGQVRLPMYSASVGRWKRYAEHIQPLLTALGIDPIQSVLEIPGESDGIEQGGAGARQG